MLQFDYDTTWGGAIGALPNSNGRNDVSTSFGRENGPSIVTMGVAATPYMDPSGDIMHNIMRQLELISNDQTNLFQSLLGNSLLEIVRDYAVSQGTALSVTTTQAGLSNSVAEMLGDVFTAIRKYAINGGESEFDG